MRIRRFNDLPGNLDMIDCQICKNKGHVMSIVDGSIVSSECVCMRKRRSLKRLQKSGLMDLVNRYRFDNFDTTEQWTRVAKKKAMEYSDKPDGRWFFLSGTPGSGKTHICTAIVSRLIESGFEARYMVWRDTAPRLKALVNDREKYESEMKIFKKVDVLYIDDFLKGSINDADINLAFELLNSRYNSSDLITIISTEKNIEQILTIDEALGSRIYERCQGFCFKTAKQNRRLNSVSKPQANAKQNESKV